MISNVREGTYTKKNHKRLKLYIASTGKGEFIVGLTKDQARLDSKAGEFIGFISHVNIFNKAFDSNVITWMSHGCGENILNAIIPWSQFIYGFLGDVNIQRPASCTDKEGGYLRECFQNTSYI